VSKKKKEKIYKYILQKDQWSSNLKTFELKIIFLKWNDTYKSHVGE
jgi:hypothetical protein